MGTSVALFALACLVVVACVVSVGIMIQNARRERGTLKEALDDLEDILRRGLGKVFSKAKGVPLEASAVESASLLEGLNKDLILEISGKKKKKKTEDKGKGKTKEKGQSGSGGKDPNNWNRRDKYLKIAKNSMLINAVNQLFRPGAYTGDGGTADILIHEFLNGQPLKHLQKARDMIDYLNRIITTQYLYDDEKKLAYQLLNELYDAVKRVTSK